VGWAWCWGTTNGLTPTSTHIILLGDNGFHLGNHNCTASTLFEDSTGVPLIIAPALHETIWARNAASLAPVELLDVMPTIVDLIMMPLAGSPQESQMLPMQGVSLVPLLQKPTGPRAWARRRR